VAVREPAADLAVREPAVPVAVREPAADLACAGPGLASAAVLARRRCGSASSAVLAVGRPAALSGSRLRPAAAARQLMPRACFVAGPAVLVGALRKERVLGQKLVGERTERHIA
jgi:hypothetical protein